MPNLCKTYTGGEPVKAADVIIGPITALAASGSVHIDSEVANCGSYVYEVSNTDGDYCALFERNSPGMALFILGAPVLFHRIRVTGIPASAGDEARVCLAVAEQR